VSSNAVPVAITAVSAVASTIAAVTAVYVGVLRVHRTSPKLTVLPFDATGPDLVELDQPASRWVWARVRIANDRGRRSAEDATVLVVQAEMGTEDGRRVELPLLAGRWLQWSDADCESVTIAPGVARRIDILTMIAGTSGTEEPEVRIPIYPPPRASRRHVVTGTQIHLELALTAKDVPATRFRLTVDIDRGWRPDRGPGPPAIVVRDIQLLS
jgi:hypothetical protein